MGDGCVTVEEKVWAGATAPAGSQEPGRAGVLYVTTHLTSLGLDFLHCQERGCNDYLKFLIFVKVTIFI